jgi:hypothetical protein
MGAQLSAQRCASGCCFYLSGRAVSEKDFRTATRGGIENADRPTLETIIPCLNIDANKNAAKEIGFYIGRPVSNSRQSSTDLYIYNATSHEYARHATPNDLEKWNEAHYRFKNTNQPG